MSTPTAADRAKALERKNEGNVFVKEKHFLKAIEKYTEAIDLDSTQSIYFSNRAFAHFKVDNFQSALNDCDEAIKLDPKNIKAYHRRALSCMALLEFKKARKI